MPSCFLKAAKNSLVTKEEPIIFRDCAEAFKSGLTTSGLYTLTFPNSTQEVKVRAPAAGVGRGGAACTGHAPGRCPAPRQAKQRTFLGVPCLQQAQGSESSLCAPTCSARGTDLGAPRSVQSPFSSQWLHRADRRPVVLQCETYVTNFKERIFQYQSLNNQFVLQSLFQVRGVFHPREGLVQLSPKTVFETTPGLWCVQVVYTHFPSATQ